MSEYKLILLMVLLFVVGALFFVVGVYLNTNSFLDKLARATGSEEKGQRIKRGGKICAFISMGIGAFSIVCGGLIKNYIFIRLRKTSANAFRSAFVVKAASDSVGRGSSEAAIQ